MADEHGTRYRGFNTLGGGTYFASAPAGIEGGGGAAGPAGTPATLPTLAAYPRTRMPPFFGSGRIKYGDILLFIIAALLAVLVIVVLLSVFVISSHHGTVVHLVSRLETVENLARNVNDASQVLRRALGAQGVDESKGGASGYQLPDKGKRPHKDGTSLWLQERDPGTEALITDNAAAALARGIRTFVRIIEQVDDTKLMEVVARTTDHADQVLAGPETAQILHTVSDTLGNPQAQQVVAQTLDLVAQIESALVPVVDALADELRLKLQELMEGDGDGMTTEAFRAMMREVVDAVHKVGGGMRDLVVWYREGGPKDAAILASELVSTARELLESPAAASLVKVLEGIDWTQTGARMGEAAHNAAAILRTVNDAGTVDAGDRLIRAVATVLEDPGTKRAMALLPGIAANATALLAKPSTQRLVKQSTALMGRVDSVLNEAEQSRTIERSAEFLGTMRNVLGALVDGGLHVELGQPGSEGHTDQQYLDDRLTPKHKKVSLLAGVPRIQGAEPEKARTERERGQRQAGLVGRRVKRPA